MKRVLGVAAVCALIAAAGCGGSENSPDEDAVRDRLASFVEAVESDDAGKICDQWTADYQESFDEFGTTCIEAMASTPADGADEYLDPRSVEIDGSLATVRYEDPKRDVFLEKIGDEWLLKDSATRRSSPPD